MPLTWWHSVGKELNRFLHQRVQYSAPDFVYGFIKGKSTRDHAANHLNQECVLRIDIEKFFPSISSQQISQALQIQNFTAEAADTVAALTTVDDGLAIGLSCSPFLSNLVMHETDNDLWNIAKSSGVTFTRYVDDLIFSGSMATRPEADEVAGRVERSLQSHGWRVNKSKTVFMRRGGRQFVTGLYVGCSDRPHIPREVKRDLRWITRMIEKVGYEEYMREFGGEEQGHYRRYLLGLARYVASVDGKVGARLLHRLDACVPAAEYEEDDDLYSYIGEFEW